uniref:autotransporter outer membrane beta-barrel domain-containing protein n=1 Tax=Azorhizobium sp. AG788 TaxID=2183897 RepID=UPI003139ED66
RLGQALSPSASAAGPTTAALAPGLTPTLWMQGFGAWGNAWGNGNAATVSSDIAGVFAGADVALGDNWRIGLMGGYSRTTLDVEARASSGTIDNYDLALYAGARYGDLGLKAGVSYTWHDAAMGRTTAFTGYSGSTTGGYDASTTQLFGEAGYTFRLDAVALQPFAGLAYVHLSTDGLTETGSSSALAVTVAGMDTVFSSLGLRLGTNLTLAPGVSVTPNLSLAWLHAFGDVNPAATMAFASGSQPFAVTGVPLARDSALIGAGLDYRLTAAAVLSASYSGQFAAGLQDNAFKGALTIAF